MDAIRVTYFSDLLCVWAYVSQRRVDELRRNHPDTVVLDVRFCSVFGDPRTKLTRRWADRGGLSAYGAHVRDVAEEHGLEVHPDVWRKLAPPSSLPCHIFLSAVRILEERGELGEPEDRLFDRACWDLRVAFFRELRNVSERAVQLEVAEKLSIPVAPLVACLDGGEAHARLSGDYALAREYSVDVSPSLILNEGRQRLRGNVGYGVIEANVRELLRQQDAEQLSG